MARHIRIGYTCCNHCRSWHGNRVTAYLHWLWLRTLGVAAS